MNAATAVLVSVGAALAKMPLKGISAIIEVTHEDGRKESVEIDTIGQLVDAMQTTEVVPLAAPKPPVETPPRPVASKPPAPAAAPAPKPTALPPKGKGKGKAPAKTPAKSKKPYSTQLDFTQYVTLAESGIPQAKWIGLPVKRQSNGSGFWCDYTVARLGDTADTVILTAPWMDDPAKGLRPESTKHVLVEKAVAYALRVNKAA